MNTTLENLLVGVATIVFGIMAGFFWTYTYNVNYAMLEVNGETYATVQSLFNQNVRHAMFFVFFFGGGFFSVLALFVNFRHWRTLPFALLAIASVVYIGGVIAFTSQVNLPLNAYTESWNPQNLPADWMDVRAQWNRANAIRVATSGSSFGLSVLSLVLRGAE